MLTRQDTIEKGDQKLQTSSHFAEIHTSIQTYNTYKLKFPTNVCMLPNTFAGHAKQWCTVFSFVENLQITPSRQLKARPKKLASCETGG